MSDKIVRELFKEIRQNNPQLSYIKSLQLVREKIEQQDENTPSWFDPLSKKRGTFYSPSIISDFVQDFLENLDPKRILDPSANFGELLFPLTQKESREVYGIDPIDEHQRIANTVFGEDITWIKGDPLEEIAETIQGKFDAIVSCPTVGKDRGNYEVSNEQNTFRLKDNYENVLMLESLKKLEKEGVGIFVVPDNKVMDLKKDTAINSLDKFGFYLQAIFSLPGDSFKYTSIKHDIIIVSRNKAENIFLGKVSKNTNQRQYLLENFRNEKEAEEPELGAFTKQDELQTVERLILKREIEKKARRRGLDPVEISEIGEVRDYHEDGGFQDFPNAIYLSRLTSGQPAVKTFEEYEGPKRSSVQLILDTDKVHPEFLVFFFNTNLGRKLLDYYSQGYFLSRTIKDIKEFEVYLPPYEVQIKFMEIHRKLENLKTELKEYEKELWKTPYAADNIEDKIDKFNLSENELFERRLENLPFPLGSILWAYHASDSKNKKNTHLFHFFEATAEFLSTILLSAIRKDEEIFERVIKTKADKTFTKYFRSATFGTWVILGKQLSKTLRGLKSNKDKKDPGELLGSADDSFINLITKKELYGILDKAKEYRNRWYGHDGQPINKEVEKRFQTLQDPLNKSIKFLTEIFQNSFIINPGPGETHNGVHDYTVQVLKGSRTPFRKEEIKTTSILDADNHYLYHQDKLEPLELLSLFKIGESPEGQKDTCYFYNRVEDESIRFVSYQMGTPSEKREVDNEIISLINSIDDLT